MEGERCTATGYECAGGWQALECRDGRWRALPCWGPRGCSEEAGRVACDMSGDLAGHACAASAEGRSVCTFQGDAVLECRLGTFVRTKACSTCTVAGDAVLCQP